MDYTNKQLDELMATRVMGWKETDANSITSSRVWRVNGDGWKNSPERISVNSWHPSTNISQAFEVVDQMIADYYIEIYHNKGEMDDYLDWFVNFYKSPTVSMNMGCDTNKSLPRAICLAAFKAVGGLND